MADSEAGSSSDAAQVLDGEYEVFLNFRGPDTRHRFTDFLYHGLVAAGVRVFRDDDELRVGEVIGGSLLRAINSSKICIPIFSQTYASSKWCLRELAHVVDIVSKSDDEKSIVPIFFDVEVDDVKLKTPLYSYALLEHEKKFPLEVQAWRAALAAVGKIKGWDCKKDQSLGATIKLVVTEVLEKLKTKRKLVTKHLIGLDERVKDLIELLDVNHDDVRLIAIYGMGGIGKTTIAKVIFNQLSSHFGKCCSFLEDIRECSTKEGMVNLQKKLLFDVVGSEFAEKFNDSEQGMQRIGETLSTKKFLVVLDNVDKTKHIEKLIGNSSLCSGSRIIITMKNLAILQVEGFRGTILPYEMLKMDDGLALKLFCQHAFGRDLPPDDYQKISSAIVSNMGGLPLVIKVIGSLLCGKGQEIWEEKLVRLRKVLDKEILEKLRISYDYLDYDQQQIFLDIACFFFNETKTNAIDMWTTCGFHPKRGIDVLISRCLINILDNDKFWMHDQLLELGRQIDREEATSDLGKQSRLWKAKEAHEIIKIEERKDRVQALEIVGPGDSIEITNEEFERLEKLPVDWENHDQQLSSGTNTSVNLEELDLSGHNEMISGIPVKIGKLSYFRILNSESTVICQILRTINMLHHLKTLKLSYCNAIQELRSPPKNLLYLYIQSRSLASVPDLSSHTNLDELVLSDVFKFGKKSKLIMAGNLNYITSPRLKKLELNPPDVPTPLQLASRSYLEELDLRPLNPKPLVQLLSSYYSWINLSTLEFFQCEVGAIPLERLPQLKKLIVDGCKQLERLSIPLELRRLCQAWVSRCPELVEIQVVGNSKSLESLRVSRCKSLIRIGGLLDLKNLEELVIQRCIVLANVEGLHELKSLKSLVVKKCTSLRWLIDPSYTNIPADCLIEIWGCGDFIKRDVTFLKRYREEILLDTTDKSMERMKDEASPGAADMETSDRNYAMAAVQKLVGIDDRVKQITKLLEMEVIDEVRIIGIYGADGIGKTTLAKAVYDRTSSCFDSCSFLAEVDETTQNSCDIRYLQTKLIRDILALDREDPSSDERMEIFVDIFRKMKVLIVVDGVENQSYLHAIVGDQLHWFGLGSRIIVTSQNEEILKEYDPEKTRTYMVSELDDGQAFELFYKHAFTMSSQYDGLADRIVNAIEKLPLPIEVVGSFLRGRSIQEWEKMEKLMKLFSLSSRKTTVGLEEILDICYKELDQQQKNIFLDIACFISDADAQIASYMWSDCYLPSCGCILMPLAKIGENNELQMDRLLRCLGKRIIEQEGSGDPSSRRFCTQDMVLEAMNREKGIENIEARDSFILTATNFASMPAISFLKLDDAKVSGDFTGAFQSLRWLCWQRCPLEFDVINFVLRELVILDLSWSKVTEDWRGWSEIKMEKLKVLNLTGCSDLLITPNFSDYKDLEILILERCSRLVKLDPSIGHLKCLVSLNMKFCSQLNGLPVELGCTTALKELFIDGTCVRQIPISIGNLKQLEVLSGFQCFPLTYLPSSICYLISLSELSLDGAKISDLPSSLGKLLELRRLSLRDCRYLENLQYSIGEMGSLEELDISATSISELPDSIRNLKSLKVLRMDSSFIRAFPGEIGNLTKLEELHASWCQSLKGAIPREIKRLCHLRSLKLGHTSISSIPREISTISSLQTLDLLQCDEIEVLPELPPSLICLHVSSKRMKDIPLLKDLKELEELYLSDEDPEERQPPSKQLKPESKVKQLSIWFSRLWNLEWLQTQRIEKKSFSIVFPKLRKLELSLSRIIKLEFLYEPTDIPQLKTLKLSGLSLEEVSELPKTLSVLSIRGCSSLKRLPIVQSLINISAFELYHCAIEEIEGLEGLKSLKRLQISNCKIQHLNGIVQLTSLRSLIVSDCDYLDSLPNLSNLKLLKVLEIRQCKMIHRIEGLEELKYLEKLKISECPAENSAQIQNVLELVMVRSVVA